MLALPVQGVHIWQVSLLQSPDCIATLAQNLSPDESERAKRFYFERDRRRFIVGRGVLRDILARYLGGDAKQLSFAYAGRGKPSLPAGPQAPNLRFNLAHSNELALYAFACGREVGIDLEYIHPIPDMDQIAARFFSAPEYQVWLALPDEQKQIGFFNCWTRKEAYIKAIGEGLSKPLDQFQVSLAPIDPARLLHVEGDEQETQRWSLQALHLDQPDYVAALIVENIAPGTGSIETFYWRAVQ